MITVEELKLQFRNLNVSPYGECVVIPKLSWNPKWTESIEGQGYDVVIDEERAPNKVLVREKVNPVIAPVQRAGATRQGRLARWLKEDEKRFLVRMGELNGTVEDKCARIVHEFPGRSVTSLFMKYLKLSHMKTLKPVQPQPSRKEADAPSFPTAPEPSSELNVDSIGTVIDSLVKQGYTVSVTVTLVSRQIR
jgi:hypothetical protein